MLANLVFGQVSLLVKLVDWGMIVRHLGDRSLMQMVDAAVPKMKHQTSSSFLKSTGRLPSSPFLA